MKTTGLILLLVFSVLGSSINAEAKDDLSKRPIETLIVGAAYLARVYHLSAICNPVYREEKQSYALSDAQLKESHQNVIGNTMILDLGTALQIDAKAFVAGKKSDAEELLNKIAQELGAPGGTRNACRQSEVREKHKELFIRDFPKLAEARNVKENKQKRELTDVERFSIAGLHLYLSKKEFFNKFDPVEVGKNKYEVIINKDSKAKVIFNSEDIIGSVKFEAYVKNSLNESIEHAVDMLGRPPEYRSTMNQEGYDKIVYLKWTEGDCQKPCLYFEFMFSKPKGYSRYNELMLHFYDNRIF